MQVPQWWEEPEPVELRCEKVLPGQHSNECIVQFKVNGDHFTAFVPIEFVNEKELTLAARIIADFGDSWLIDIPSETLTSGPRIRVGEKEKESVVVRRAA